MEELHDRDLESFMKWAAELGISDVPRDDAVPSSSSCIGHSLSISYFPSAGGRGLAAARHLRKGELILRVPKSALMTRDSLLEKNPNLAVAANRHPSLSSIQMLAVCLLAEMCKGRKSFWYPYLMQMPRSYDILASFGPFESKAFQVDDAIWVTERAISKAESDWNDIIALLHEIKLRPQFATFKAWLWAFATISSRTLHIPWDEAGCLCPVGDFFNYSAPGEDLVEIENLESHETASSVCVGSFGSGSSPEDLTLVEDLSDSFSGRLTDGGYEECMEAYCFYAKKSYRKGEQVLLSYGTYTNLELLEHYGFLLEENPNDKVFMRLGPDIVISNSWPTDALYIQHDGRPSFALLSALRLWATPPKQRKSVSHLVFSGTLLSTENEIAVINWLASKCNAMLESLPSSIEDDRLLLSAIDTIQDLRCLGQRNKLPFVSWNELKDFLESNGLWGGEIRSEVHFTQKVKRSLDRWKLAIQWRLRYKTILADCISLCSQNVKSLSTSLTNDYTNYAKSSG